MLLHVLHTLRTALNEFLSHAKWLSFSSAVEYFEVVHQYEYFDLYRYEINKINVLFLKPEHH